MQKGACPKLHAQVPCNFCNQSVLKTHELVHVKL